MVDEKMKISKEADARYGAVATDNSGQVRTTKSPITSSILLSVESI